MKRILLKQLSRLLRLIPSQYIIKFGIKLIIWAVANLRGEDRAVLLMTVIDKGDDFLFQHQFGGNATLLGSSIGLSCSHNEEMNLFFNDLIAAISIQKTVKTAEA